MNGIRALMKEGSDADNSLALFPMGGPSKNCSLTVSRVYTYLLKWIAFLEPGSGLSPDAEFVAALILDFPPSRSMRNKCVYITQ